jgi:hypothetical protein
MKSPSVRNKSQEGIFNRIPFAGAQVSKYLVVDPAMRKYTGRIVFLRHHHRLILEVFPCMVAIEYHGATVGFNGIDDVWNIPLGKTTKGQKQDHEKDESVLHNSVFLNH